MSLGMLRTKAKFWITDAELERWFSNRKVFFVLAMGRSGTNFLAHLFENDRDALVFHEPVIEDLDSLAAAHKSPQSARDYIATFRKKRIYELAKPFNPRVYGEVNSNLRFHAEALKQCIPGVRLMHLVRDGRDVVRSIMNRQHFTGKGGHYHEFGPCEDDALYGSWDSMERFEKVCWLWADANRRLRQDVSHMVKFERLVQDYRYFYESVERYLGIRVGQDAWKHAVSRPTNISKKFVLPSWENWGNELAHQFERICGEEMRELGYW